MFTYSLILLYDPSFHGKTEYHSFCSVFQCLDNIKLIRCKASELIEYYYRIVHHALHIIIPEALGKKLHPSLRKLCPCIP